MKNTLTEGYSIQEALRALSMKDDLTIYEGKNRKGQGNRWKNKGIGQKYGFDEDNYVVHHINGDPEFDIDPDTGEPNLALIPSATHNQFKKDNLGEWEKIKQNFDTSNIVEINGVKFILALPKITNDLTDKSQEKVLSLA